MSFGDRLGRKAFWTVGCGEGDVCDCILSVSEGGLCVLRWVFAKSFRTRWTEQNNYSRPEMLLDGWMDMKGARGRLCNVR